jgi:porphobilinogen synthase
MLSRPRRNRQSAAIRGLVREPMLYPSQLVLPLFLLPGADTVKDVPSLPGTKKYTLDRLYPVIEEAIELGVNSFILFPAVPESKKDTWATYSYNPSNFYLFAASEIKRLYPQVCLISDVAMDPYNSDGHDGYVTGGRIGNDETLPVLARMAVAQARAGFDMLGPSDMMDGRVQFIREALDAEGFTDTGILAYTAKYASGLYGPFRDALDSAPKIDPTIPSDKKTYQMDPTNRREALREAALDEAEGADMLMVKPALHYLDIISDLKANSNLPIAAYHVSGECAMLLAACQNGWLDYERMLPETLQSIHRAGADIILTYLALDYARWFRGA